MPVYTASADVAASSGGGAHAASPDSDLPWTGSGALDEAQPTSEPVAISTINVYVDHRAEPANGIPRLRPTRPTPPPGATVSTRASATRKYRSPLTIYLPITSQ